MNGSKHFSHTCCTVPKSEDGLWRMFFFATLKGSQSTFWSVHQWRCVNNMLSVISTMDMVIFSSSNRFGMFLLNLFQSSAIGQMLTLHSKWKWP